MNTELLEYIATIYYRTLATGEEIQILLTTAIDFFADMRKLRFNKKEDNYRKLNCFFCKGLKREIFSKSFVVIVFVKPDSPGQFCEILALF